MKTVHLPTILFARCGLIGALLVGPASEALTQTGKIEYPHARRADQIDDYHGVEVEDPYRWMEEMDSEETRAWMEAQDRLLESFVGAFPARVAILERIHALGELGPAHSVPMKRGSLYFFQKGLPGQTQSALYITERLGGSADLLLDPNTYFEDEELRMGGHAPSPDGRFVALNVRRLQSRWARTRIVAVDSGREEDGRLETVTAGSVVAWAGDSEGFFYIDYGDFEELESGAADPLPQILFHRVGAEQSEDELVYSRPDRPSWLYSTSVTEDGRYLIISVFDGGIPGNRVLYKDLKDPEAEVREIPTAEGAAYLFLGNEAGRFWFYTDLNAPRGRVVSIDIGEELERWVQVIRETEETMAGGSAVGGNAIKIVGGRIVALYRKDSRSIVRSFDLDGALEHEEILDIGWVGSGFVGRQDEPQVRFSLNTFTRSTTVYGLDLESGELATIFQRELPLNPDDYVTRQVFYKSKDGTRVPMFLAHKKGLELDGSSPAFMYGYGYAAWVATPWYQPQMMAWLDMGGIYAMPGIRGGGEYGEEWHKAGVRLNRQNAIDDFIAAAEWLIESGHTSPSLMVANGGSASGSLAAAALVQRPDLFGAGIIDIPSLDMLRYHQLTTFKGWTRGFGSSENAEEFRALFAYSPYHNIESGVCYPPMLITVGERDQGAPPLHGYKFTAAMQAQQGCDNPALIKIVWGAGHSFGTSREQTSQTQADQLAFLARVLELEMPEQYSAAGSR